jgi:hypothetical protein
MNCNNNKNSICHVELNSPLPNLSTPAFGAAAFLCATTRISKQQQQLRLLLLLLLPLERAAKCKMTLFDATVGCIMNCSGFVNAVIHNQIVAENV